jgi:branched-chain amino acid transport system ATP-binding protein
MMRRHARSAASHGRTPGSRCANLEGLVRRSHVLHGVDLDIREGEVVTLLGRNGAGKTTTLRAIMGLVSAARGLDPLRGRETIGLRAHRIARPASATARGARHLREPDAQENLMLPPRVAEGGMSVDEIYTLFPNLKERAPARAPSCRAASSRCWPSPASCAPAPGCSCSTSPRRAWRR